MFLRAFALPLMLASACALGAREAPAASAPAALETIDGWAERGEALDVYFVPSGPVVEDRLEAAILGAERRIRVALYNLRSERLAHALLARHREGLEVELLLDAKQMDQPWNTLGAWLEEQGLPVVPVRNERHRYATLHDKLALVDDAEVFLGSANWGPSGLHANEEALLALRSPALAAVVDAELDEIASDARHARVGDVPGPMQLHFSPTDRLDAVIERAIDGAEERVLVAVFSLRLRWLAEALVDAHRRGVEVWVVTDRKQADYTDVDELLEAAGVPVLRALNATGEHTAMHHKFAVVDGRLTLTGSYNWSWTATFASHEDLAAIDDREVAAAFEGEFGRLWARYGGARPNPVTASMPVRVDAFAERTAFGDTLALVGDDPALGAWDPWAGVRLDGASWPSWRGEVALRPGARVAYKLVVLHPDARVSWERGANRHALVPTDPQEPTLELRDAFRW